MQNVGSLRQNTNVEESVVLVSLYKDIFTIFRHYYFCPLTGLCWLKNIDSQGRTLSPWEKKGKRKKKRYYWNEAETATQPGSLKQGKQAKIVGIDYNAIQEGWFSLSKDLGLLLHSGGEKEVDGS